jgi:hypothetical protein
MHAEASALAAIRITVIGEAIAQLVDATMAPPPLPTAPRWPHGLSVS